jgi:hypothetical protein
VRLWEVAMESELFGFGLLLMPPIMDILLALSVRRMVHSDASSAIKSSEASAFRSEETPRRHRMACLLALRSLLNLDHQRSPGHSERHRRAQLCVSDPMSN